MIWQVLLVKAACWVAAYCCGGAVLSLQCWKFPVWQRGLIVDKKLCKICRFERVNFKGWNNKNTAFDCNEQSMKGGHLSIEMPTGPQQEGNWKGNFYEYCSTWIILESILLTASRYELFYSDSAVTTETRCVYHPCHLLWRCWGGNADSFYYQSAAPRSGEVLAASLRILADKSVIQAASFVPYFLSLLLFGGSDGAALCGGARLPPAFAASGSGTLQTGALLKNTGRICLFSRDEEGRDLL